MISYEIEAENAEVTNEGDLVIAIGAGLRRTKVKFTPKVGLI
jgi:hypothetical protein